MNQLDQQLYELFAYKELISGCIEEIEWKFYRFIQISSEKTKIRWREIMLWKHLLSDWIVFFSHEWWRILWSEPQLHDVFRVAKDRNINLIVYQWINQIVFGDRNNNEKEISRIPYNPTIPLLQQDESTKESIINLFK